VLCELDISDGDIFINANLVERANGFSNLQFIAAKIDEDRSMNDIVAGFLKFRETGYHERTELFHQLAHAQSPGALFVACSDSRVVPELEQIPLNPICIRRD
jgi:hypothetical protein